MLMSSEIRTENNPHQRQRKEFRRTQVMLTVGQDIHVGAGKQQKMSIWTAQDRLAG